MKRIIITLLAVSLITVSSAAQQKKTMKGSHRQKHNHGKMARSLNFSEDQKKQAKLYKDDAKKKMQELNKNESITVKEFRDRKEMIRKERRSKMQGLLTVEQKTKMALLNADQQKKREEHFTRHLNKMRSALTLTDAQVAQLKSQREKIRLQSRSIRDNGALTREQRKIQMGALREDLRAQRKNIFTPEQLKKMEEMRKNRLERATAR